MISCVATQQLAGLQRVRNYHNEENTGELKKVILIAYAQIKENEG